MYEMKEEIPNKWGKSILVTLLGGFAIEVFFLFYSNIAGNKDVSDMVPWTFHTLWELAALGAVAYVVYKCKIQVGNFLLGMLFGSILCGLIWIFIPDSFKIVGANYYGVESRIATDTHVEGRYDERVEYDFPLTPVFLFHKDDPNLKIYFKEEAKLMEYAGIKGFLFWQTGLAYGFVPLSVPQYKGARTYLDRVKLFFSVGPMVLVESFIIGFIKYFAILMIVQVVWYLIRKEQVWWD